MTSLICFSCSTEVQLSGPISRRDECTKCGADLRVCKNCEFYDAKAYNECREPQAERIQEKERSNLCDFFRPRDKSMTSEKDKAAQLRAAAEALFKKS